jgi:hypothetical protein
MRKARKGNNIDKVDAVVGWLGSRLNLRKVLYEVRPASNTTVAEYLVRSTRLGPELRQVGSGKAVHPNYKDALLDEVTE